MHFISMKLTNFTVLLFIGLISFCSILTSCNELGIGKLSEGSIEYRIEYPEIPEDNYLLDLLPAEMVTIFKSDAHRSDITAGMGLFKTSIICNEENENVLHVLKVLNKKYYSELDEKSFFEINPSFKNIKFEETGNTKMIAGYNCKELLVKMNLERDHSFHWYYTDEIKMNHPKDYSPFGEIDGVLLEYELINYDTYMRFIAESVYREEIEDSKFLIGEEYEKLSPSDLNQEIESIFSKVK